MRTGMPRKMDDGQRVSKAIKAIDGKRLLGIGGRSAIHPEIKGPR